MNHMARVLVTWADRGVDGPAPGHQGPRPSADRGPVMRLVEHAAAPYARALVLTLRAGLGRSRALVDELRALEREVELRPVDVDDPSDHAALFRALGPICGELADPRLAIDVLLSAGTPQMQTLWVILVQARLLRARMLQVIPAAFVPVPHPRPIREVSLDIAGFPEIRALRDEVSRLRAEVRARAGQLTAASAAMQALLDRLTRVARSALPVLVLGETGTGKELVARAIHAGSERADGPFVAENCGAIAESMLASELFGHEAAAFTGAGGRHRGLFEQATGGTIFLDEVGELPLAVQAMLLRVLQERTVRRVGGEHAIAVDVRVVAATHRDLPAMVRAGQFREDLYYRLRGATLHVPPLRERAADLPALIDAFWREAALRGIPIVFTLHDYWLMCPRGQFMQMMPEDPNVLWAACDGQEDRKCAERCYSRYFSGAADEHESDVAYWTDWVKRRMHHVREMADLVDLFIAPAKYLHNRFRDAFGLPERKMVYLDYGFARERMQGRVRDAGEPFTFGYIGTHIPAKGVHDLIRAFGKLTGNARLRIWGRPRGQDTEALKSMAASLPAGMAERVEWLTEYKNQEIARDVFGRCDAIVVPSLWVENSPLVIHEAQQARVPVITANAGGMAEYVHHDVNGLLFEHRSVESLAAQMQRFVDDPELAKRLGARGYVFSENGDIPDVENHVREIEKLYAQVLERHASSRITRSAGPWRITFDTNPDTCNLKCIMCEEHSEHSLLQLQRKKEGRDRRVMPFEMIEKVIAEAAPHGLREIIPSTMGEPLLYDQFEGIIELCQRYGVKLNLTTNGTFPRLGAAEWAKRIVPVTSDVKISWNGGTKATHEAIMVGSKWENVLENARTFIAIRDAHAAAGGNRCRVTFQLTFLESNVHELADMVRLAIELGVDRVKGHHLWAHLDRKSVV